MKDSLKDFIDNNRQAFDDQEPSDKVWKGIRSGLPKQSIWNSVGLWRVAAIILFGISAWLVVDKTRKSDNHQDMARLQGEFTNLEKFYSEQIAERVEWISDSDDFPEGDEFTQDFKKLDAMYQVLREQMRNSPTEQVRDALVLNLLVRIDLLNQQIHKLEETRRASGADKQSAI